MWGWRYDGRRYPPAQQFPVLPTRRNRYLDLGAVVVVVDGRSRSDSPAGQTCLHTHILVFRVVVVRPDEEEV
jgi:hypothetical protein